MQYLISVLLLLIATPAAAVDSYRFLHVTIETPWMIFLFLLVVILFPFILTAILHWHFARKKAVEQQANNEPEP
jgi:hypothetical protein